MSSIFMSCIFTFCIPPPARKRWSVILGPALSVNCMARLQCRFAVGFVAPEQKHAECWPEFSNKPGQVCCLEIKLWIWIFKKTSSNRLYNRLYNSLSLRATVRTILLTPRSQSQRTAFSIVFNFFNCNSPIKVAV